MTTGLVAVALIVVGGGCGQTRPSQTEAQLLALRAQADARTLSDARAASVQLALRAKAQYDEYKAGRRPAPPTIDVLIISGGGDWGAFTAGFLKGWGRVPASHPLARPQFAAVTGVSAGATIAPFAVLGDEASIDLAESLYRNPQPDWVRRRGPLFFLASNPSFAEVPGLEREVRTVLSEETIRRIEAAGADGRMLAIGATNLDDASPRVFDLVAEARRARQSGDYERIRTIVLASAAIPAAFPARMIDGQMYVDGAVTGNIIYGEKASPEDDLAPVWKELFPDAPVPRIRFWVLFNNQFRPPPTVTEPRWRDVLSRSLETSTRASTQAAIRHLAAMAETSRLKWHADVEVRLASIPGDWKAPKAGWFQKETMNALADLGEQMGANPSSWRTPEP